jgi:hypothetical protein
MGNEGEIVAEHERRLGKLDRLLPQSYPLPEPTEDDTPLVVPGGVGLARRTATDLDALEAGWLAADVHRLLARVGGADPVAAMAGLLAGWRDQVHASAKPDDPDSAAVLSWPSRDTAMTRSFLDLGLTPRTVLAIRPAGYPSVGRASDVRIRPLAEADLDVAVDLHLEETRWDSQFGAMVERASSAAQVREVYERLPVGLGETRVGVS